MVIHIRRANEMKGYDMTIENSDQTRPGSGSSGARVGRAAAWFAAGALGATALTGVAVAATTDADNGEQSPETQVAGPRGPGGMFGPGGHGGRARHPGGPAGGPMLHSEGVIEDQDGGFQDVVMQRGKVTEVSDKSITVQSSDEHSEAFEVNDETKIHKDRDEKLIDDIAVGDTVHVMAKKDGDKSIAVRLGAISAEKAAGMEETRQRFQEYREQLRNGEIEELPEEMREFFEERREQRQNGDAKGSGFRGGPPAGALNS